MLLTFQDTKEQLLIGLWSRELSNNMACRGHTNATDLYQDMIRMERINAQRMETIWEEKSVVMWPKKTTEHENK